MRKRIISGLLAVMLLLAMLPLSASAAEAGPDSYLDMTITEDMTTAQKLDAICRYVAGFDYSPYASTADEMLLIGGGDSRAGSELVLRMCQRLGFTAWLRDATGDGNGTQVNVMVSADGKYYQLETGFQEMAPRPYEITERSSLFSYRFTDGGICVYQYDGQMPQVLIVPQAIDGYGVVAIGEQFLASQKGVTQVILPDTLETIGDDAFNACADLQTLVLPSSVREIGQRAFAGCDKLSGLSAPDSLYFTVKDHILYTADRTQVVAAPYCETAFLPATVTTIRPYAFLCSGTLKQAVIPKSVTSIGEGAFGDCGKLSMITFQGNEPQLADFLFFGVLADAYAAWTPAQTESGITWHRYTPAADITATTDGSGGITALSIRAFSGGTAMIPMKLDGSGKELLNVTTAGSPLTLQIPMEDPGSGCMVFRRHSDGSFQLVKEAIVTDYGMEITVSEHCTLMVVDKSLSFTDIPKGYWAEDEIDYLTARGIITGKLDGTFQPGETITRKTVAMILWRIMGSPEVPVDTLLTDVRLSDRYTQAICWAEDAGIITGYADGTFRGDGQLTRQHFAVMLYRFAKFAGYELTPENSKQLGDFDDSAAIYSWAREACLWAVQNGLINGRANNTFDPQGNTSRAQLAVILARFLKKTDTPKLSFS